MYIIVPDAGTGMPSLIHSSPLLDCRTIAYLNSLPLLELGTDLPRPSPGEVLSFFGVSPVNYSDSNSDSSLDTRCCESIRSGTICSAWMRFVNFS